MSSGVFQNENAAAAVLTGTLGGQDVLVLAFRGSDDPTDWKNDFQNINADYPKFDKLFALTRLIHRGDRRGGQGISGRSRSCGLKAAWDRGGGSDMGHALEVAEIRAQRG